MADWTSQLDQHNSDTLRERHIPRGLSSVMSGVARRASGVRVEDASGRAWIDFAGGIGVVNVGHGHPRVVAAIRAQADRYLHTAAQVLLPDTYLALAARLNAITPGAFAKKTLLVNSGAEAVENAVKIARVATGRAAVIAFEGAFHGRTLLGLTLTHRAYPFKTGFGPFAPAVYHSPYAYPYRCPAGGGDAECTTWALARLGELLDRELPPASVAAVIIEPVLGEGGFVVPPAAFLPGVAALAKRHDAVLIADEIQTGFGRTGRMFACEHAGIEPDIIVTGKSLAAGLPLAAVTGRADLMDAPVPGSLGSTYGGNPVACAAALAVLEVFEEERLVERAAEIGRRTRARLEAMAARSDVIGEVRGLGAMLAIELVRDRQTKEPDPLLTAAVLRACHERGLLVLRAGSADNVIRLLMPLVISDADLERGIDILEEAMQLATAAPASAASRGSEKGGF